MKDSGRWRAHFRARCDAIAAAVRALSRLPGSSPGVTQARRGEKVVLVHGLWMTGAVCALLARRLRACGFEPLLFSYPSVRMTLEQVAERLERFVHERSAERGPLRRPQPGRAGGAGAAGARAVGCGGASRPAGQPEHQLARCRAARRLARRAGAGGACAAAVAGRAWRGGRAAGGDGRDRRHREVRRGKPGGDAARPNDGAVTVAETQLPGLRDHLVLPVTHSGLLVSARVARQVCTFLTHGRFARA